MPTTFCLAEILKRVGMSQSDLSRRSGVNLPTINRICGNKTVQVALSTLDRIADALGVAPGELIAKEKAKRR